VPGEHDRFNAVLGNSRLGGDGERDVQSRTTEHADQRIDAEQADLAPHQVANAGLRDPEQLRGLSLSEAAGLNQAAQLDHQIGPELEILGLLRRKAQIQEDVAR